MVIFFNEALNLKKVTNYLNRKHLLFLLHSLLSGSRKTPAYATVSQNPRIFSFSLLVDSNSN